MTAEVRVDELLIRIYNNKMIRLTVGVIVLIAFQIAGVFPAAAQIYRWIDEQGNSQYTQGLDSIPERYRASAIRLRYESAPPAAPVPAGADASRDTVIQFTPGKPIYVTARVNDSASVRLVLDTGADRTVISQRALVAAGVSTRGASAAGKIQGVTGEAEVKAYNIESLQVGNAKVGWMLVISHDIHDPNSDGLLGRDFLARFKVTIDSAAGQVTLSPK